jgi:G3E family GTPase
LLEKASPTGASRVSVTNDHDHHHHHVHSEDDPLPHAAATFFLPLPTPLPRQDFERFINQLPAAVFRAKGFVRFTSSQETYTFQKVRDQTELILLPLEGVETVATGLVLIGPHLDLSQLRAMAETTLLPTTA